jgi:hypothetical protein
MKGKAKYWDRWEFHIWNSTVDNITLGDYSNFFIHVGLITTNPQKYSEWIFNGLYSSDFTHQKSLLIRIKKGFTFTFLKSQGWQISGIILQIQLLMFGFQKWRMATNKKLQHYCYRVFVLVKPMIISNSCLIDRFSRIQSFTSISSFWKN